VESDRLQEKNKLNVLEVMRLSTLLHQREKTIEQQLETIENLEKLRDNQIKTATENADTVSEDIGLPKYIHWLL